MTFNIERADENILLKSIINNKHALCLLIYYTYNKLYAIFLSLCKRTDIYIELYTNT